MGFTYIVKVDCDADCENTHSIQTDTALEAEKDALDDGWIEDRGRHYCPEHNNFS